MAKMPRRAHARKFPTTSIHETVKSSEVVSTPTRGEMFVDLNQARGMIDAAREAVEDLVEVALDRVSKQPLLTRGMVRREANARGWEAVRALRETERWLNELAVKLAQGGPR